MNLEAGEQAAMARARWFTEFLSAWRWLILAVILVLAAGSVYLMKDIIPMNPSSSKTTPPLSPYTASVNSSATRIMSTWRSGPAGTSLSAATC